MLVINPFFDDYLPVIKPILVTLLLLATLGKPLLKAQAPDNRKLMMASVLRVNPPNDKRLALVAPFDAPNLVASLTSTPYSRAVGKYPASPTDNQLLLRKEDVGKVMMLLGDLKPDGQQSVIWNAQLLEVMEPSRAISFWLSVRDKDAGQFFPDKNGVDP